MCIGNKYQTERVVEPWVAYIVLFVFIMYCIGSTVYNAKKLRHIHFIKKRDGYIYDKSDITFDDNKTLVKIVIYCFIAGTLGGIVGIAGGIILNPLFL